MPRTSSPGTQLNQRRKALVAAAAKQQRVADRAGKDLAKAQAALEKFDSELSALLGAAAGKPAKAVAGTSGKPGQKPGPKSKAVGASVAVKSAAKPAVRRRRPRSGGMTVRDAIMATLAGEESMSVEKLVASAGEKHNANLKVSTTRATLSALKKDGRVTNDKTGWKAAQQ